jgi:hypothetical protein
MLSRYNLNHLSHKLIQSSQIIAWVLVTGTVLAIAIQYPQLPAELPVSRWHNLDKSWLIALRIPLLNACSLGLLEILNRSLFRHHQITLSFLYMALAIKALMEGIELLLLPTKIITFIILMFIVVLVGICLTALQIAPFWSSQTLKQWALTAAEKRGIYFFCIVMAALNIPLILR